MRVHPLHMPALAMMRSQHIRISCKELQNLSDMPPRRLLEASKTVRDVVKTVSNQQKS